MPSAVIPANTASAPAAFDDVSDLKNSPAPREASTSAAAALPTIASAADWSSLSGIQTRGKTYPGGFHEGLARDGYLIW